VHAKNGRNERTASILAFWPLRRLRQMQWPRIALHGNYSLMRSVWLSLRFIFAQLRAA